MLSDIAIAQALKRRADRIIGEATHRNTVRPFAPSLLGMDDTAKVPRHAL